MALSKPQFFIEVNAEVNRENPNSVKLQTNNNEIKHFFSKFFEISGERELKNTPGVAKCPKFTQK